MDIGFIKDWLIPVSTAVGVLSAVVALFTGLREYKLKVHAERRLAETATVEADVKLLKLFSELMDVAHARGQSVLASEKLFEALWPHMKNAGATNPLDAAVITMPVGAAAQDAAMAALAALGKRHAVLRPAAIHGLERLAAFKPNPAARLLEELRSEV